MMFTRQCNRVQVYRVCIIVFEWKIGDESKKLPYLSNSDKFQVYRVLKRKKGFKVISSLLINPLSSFAILLCYFSLKKWEYLHRNLKRFLYAGLELQKLLVHYF